MIEWDDGPHAKLNTKEIVARSKRQRSIRARLRRISAISMRLSRAPSPRSRRIPVAGQSATVPTNCTVHVRKDGCEVWVGSQVIARAQAAGRDCWPAIG